MNESILEEACSQKQYNVHLTDLPLSCPMPKMTLWDAHPRVYLDIETKGEVSCPYCGARYILVE